MGVSADEKLGLGDDAIDDEEPEEMVRALSSSDPGMLSFFSLVY